MVMQPRAVLWAAVVLRLSVAVLLFAAPQFSPFRDYGVEDTDAGAIERIWRRPAVIAIAEDELAYDAIARSIASGEGWVSDRNWMLARPGQPTAYGGAVYPLFVGILYLISANGFPLVVLAQLALSIWAVFGLMRIGRTLGGESAGIAVGWLSALHPGLVVVPALLMTEALSIPIVVAIVVLALRLTKSVTVPAALVAGAMIGTGFLVRSPLGLMALGCVVGALAVHGARRAWRPALVGAGAALAAMVLVLTPWTVRNFVHYDRFMPADSKSGVNLWMFNLPPGVTPRWDEIGQLGEGEADALYRERALDNIKGNLGWFIGETSSRAVRFWWPVPRRLGTPLHWLGVAAYTALTFAALAGVLALLLRALMGDGGALVVVMPLVIGWGLMAITAVGLRHRLTVEPLLLICAGTFLCTFIERRIQVGSRLSSLP